MLCEQKTAKPTGGTLMGHVAALIAVLMWGYSFVSSKVLLDNGLGPVQVYILRFTIAYLLIVCINHKRFKANLKDEGLFMIAGLCAGSIYFIAENTALEYTLTTNVSLLTSMSPLITAILVSVIYPNEKLGMGTWIGSILAVCGVVCVVFNSSTNIAIKPLGDFLSLAAAVSWAIYCIVMRRLNANYDVWVITRKTFFYGLVTALPFLFFERESVDLFVVIQRPEVYLNLLFLGIGASTISYVLWAVVVKQMGAVKANNYLYLQPIVTLIVSAIVLGEHVTLTGFIGIMLIICGLWAGDNINKYLDKRIK